MKKPPFPIADERMASLTGQLAFVVLSLTQVALLGAILWRRYHLHLPATEYNDLRIILGGSLFGFIALRLYLGAAVRMVRLRTLGWIYAGSVLGLTVILTIWHGPPTLATWHVTILPVLVGPALLLGAYALLAWLGERRIEKQLRQTEE